MKNTSGLWRGRKPPSEAKVKSLVNQLINGVRFVNAAKNIGYKDPYNFRYRLKNYFPEIYEQVLGAEEYFLDTYTDKAESVLDKMIESTNEKTALKTVMWVLERIDPRYGGKSKLQVHKHEQQNIVITDWP